MVLNTLYQNLYLLFSEDNQFLSIFQVSRFQMANFIIDSILVLLMLPFEKILNGQKQS
jgi:hypothetical protein